MTAEQFKKLMVQTIKENQNKPKVQEKKLVIVRKNKT